MAATHVVVYFDGQDDRRPLVSIIGDAQHMKIVTVGFPEGEQVVFQGEFFSQEAFDRLKREQDEQTARRNRKLPDSLER